MKDRSGRTVVTVADVPPVVRPLRKPSALAAASADLAEAKALLIAQARNAVPPIPDDEPEPGWVRGKMRAHEEGEQEARRARAEKAMAFAASEKRLGKESRAYHKLEAINAKWAQGRTSSGRRGDE